MVLGIIPKAFNKEQLPKQFPSNLAATSHSNFRGAESCGFDGIWGRALQTKQVWGLSAAARTELGSCRFVNC